MRGIATGGSFFTPGTAPQLNNWRRRWRRTRSSSASWTGDWNTASSREVFMPFSLFVATGDGGGTDNPRSRLMTGVGR